MPDIRITSPAAPGEWQAYFDLRWRILREPWQQPRGSEKDAHEIDGFHVMAITADHTVVGVGRIHRINSTQAQIRYMAVAEKFQSQGIGTTLLQSLEMQAKAWHMHSILLNARENAASFYRRHGYNPTGESFVLYNAIPHHAMIKTITSRKKG